MQEFSYEYLLIGHRIETCKLYLYTVPQEVHTEDLKLYVVGKVNVIISDYEKVLTCNWLL